MRYHSSIVMILVFIIVYQYLSYNSKIQEFEKILLTFKITLVWTFILALCLSKTDEERYFPRGPRTFVEAPHFIKYNIETDIDLYRKYQIAQRNRVRKNTLRFNRSWSIKRRYSTNLRVQRILIYPFLMRNRNEQRIVPSCMDKLSYYRTVFSENRIPKEDRNFVLNSNILITTSIEEYINAIINHLCYPDRVFNNPIVSKNALDEGYGISGKRISSIHFLNERTGDYTIFQLKVHT